MGWGYRSEHQHIYDYEADMFTGITTYHGMVRIYNSSSWIGRWFWIFIVFTSFVLFVLQSVQLLIQYHGRPTVSQINFVVPPNGMKFPVLTLCNFNPIKKSKLKKWNMSEEVIDYAMMAFLQPYDLQKDYNISYVNYLHDNFEKYIDYYKTLTGKDFRFRSFYRQAGFDCEDLFLNCSYGGRAFDCCNGVYMDEIMTDYGKCFQFTNVDNNIAMIERWALPQTVDGFEIMIDLKGPETPDFFINDISDTGIKFLIHDKKTIPLLSVNTFAVSPGYKLYGAVSYRNISLLPKENGWGMCRNNWDNLPPGNSKLYIDEPYSSVNCMKNCLVNVFEDLCGCVPIRYQVSGILHFQEYPSNFVVSDTLEVCAPIELLNCTLKNRMQVIWNKFWTDDCGCAVGCDRLDYDVAMSYSEIPNRQAEEYFSEEFNVSSTYMKQNFIVLNLYMKQIYYERHEQTKTLNQMSVLSQIGGSMGLFMGMSLITLAEIFIFLFKTIYGMAYGNRKAQALAKQECDECLEAGQYNFAYDDDLDQYGTVYDPPDWFLHESVSEGAEYIQNQSSTKYNSPQYLDPRLVGPRPMSRKRTGTTMRPPAPTIIVEDVEPTQLGFRTRGYTRIEYN